MKYIKLYEGFLYEDNHVKSLEERLSELKFKGKDELGEILIKYISEFPSTKYRKLIYSLIDMGANLSYGSYLGRTPLHIAVFIQDSEIVEYLINNGSNVNIKDSIGFIPLNFTNIPNSNKDIIDMLLNADSDINNTDNNGWSIIHYASQSNNCYLIDNCIKMGVNLEQKNTDSYTPLHISAIDGNLDIVAKLIDNNVDINSKTNDGKTALILSCINSHIPVIEILLNNSADITIIDNQGKTAWDYANDEIRDICRGLSQ